MRLRFVSGLPAWQGLQGRLERGIRVMSVRGNFAMLEPHCIQILLVDDNPVDVSLIQEALAESQARPRISVTQDGEDALHFLQQQGRHRQAPRPDLILLDLNLPKKDGRELLAEMKRDPSLRNIPVIVLTTSEAHHDVCQAYDLHANCYLRKPAELQAFRAMIQSVDRFWLNVARLPSC
jgi:two-component system, chemotaxis family, response regulator Rcp1